MPKMHNDKTLYCMSQVHLDLAFKFTRIIECLDIWIHCMRFWKFIQLYCDCNFLHQIRHSNTCWCIITKSCMTGHHISKASRPMCLMFLAHSTEQNRQCSFFKFTPIIHWTKIKTPIDWHHSLVKHSWVGGACKC